MYGGVISKLEHHDEDETNGSALEKRGNGSWAPFTSESGKVAQQKRIEYQRQLKAQAREELYRQAQERVRESVDFQKSLIDKAQDPEYVMDKEEERKNKLALAASKDTLDRLTGKASVHIEIHQEDEDIIELDDAWVVDEPDEHRELEA